MFHGYFNILSYFIKKSIDFSGKFDIIIMFAARDRNTKHNADWCNGSTADSDSVSRGSNPLSVAFEVWLSLVERCVRDAEVAGSNPVTSTPWQGRGRLGVLFSRHIIYSRYKKQIAGYTICNVFISFNADWCNGSTADSDSVSRGSNPLSVV